MNKSISQLTSQLKNEKTKRGFTLIELLLALLILSFVLVCIYQTFQAGFAAQKFAEGKSDLYQNGRLALSRLSRELRCSFTSADNPNLKFIGEESRIDYVSAYSTTLKEISYFYDKESQALMRREAPVPDEESKRGGLTSLMAESISELSFHFFDGENWQSVWEDENLPEGIKINLVLEDKEKLNLSTKICLRR